ncbi:uncharacterized protein N7515_005498 [Penicillium bovifimosum]|uniref:Uncharacterized protein n=1 Tax=Penicillium bovifimosum TaxID=126998 RepID=A0A9W9GUG5_9EURO|nr:uncharacterized protein N7515_005498 [Penicillium bovifimosum]KAJ5129459.1 hypothetical protein N7515_005498 [Penicillium bovifimosum]
MEPTKHGCFTFDNDTFFATTSDNYTHPRAEWEVLWRIFCTRLRFKFPNPDHPGHWYRAQVLHYGLAPTGNDAKAKMRLQDAYQDGRLTIPKGILKIEKELQLEWEITKAMQEAVGPTPAPQSSDQSSGWTATVADHTRNVNPLKRSTEDDGASNDRDCESQSERKEMIPIAPNQSAGELPTSAAPNSYVGVLSYVKLTI